MKRVVIESPYYSRDKAEQQRNIAYAIECLRDSMQRGEAPFASHLLYTRVLDDDEPQERRQGLDAAMRWIDVSERTAVYIDLGLSSGMRLGIQRAYKPYRVVVRTLRQDHARVARIQEAYNLRHTSLPPEQCDHQLDSPILESAGTSAFHIGGWRCGCGRVRVGQEEPT